MKFKRLVWSVLAGVLALTPEFLVERYRYVDIDRFGFYAWFGGGMCALMLLVALLVGKLIKREDDYYD